MTASVQPAYIQVSLPANVVEAANHLASARWNLMSKHTEHDPDWGHDAEDILRRLLVGHMPASCADHLIDCITERQVRTATVLYDREFGTTVDQINNTHGWPLGDSVPVELDP